jgi:hypothetical protein
MSLLNHSQKRSTNPPSMSRVAYQEYTVRVKGRVVLQVKSRVVHQVKSRVVHQVKSRVVHQVRSRVVLQAQECRVPPQPGAQTQVVSPNQRLTVISPPSQ